MSEFIDLIARIAVALETLASNFGTKVESVVEGLDRQAVIDELPGDSSKVAPELVEQDFGFTDTPAPTAAVEPTVNDVIADQARLADEVRALNKAGFDTGIKRIGSGTPIAKLQAALKAAADAGFTEAAINTAAAATIPNPVVATVAAAVANKVVEDISGIGTPTAPVTTDVSGVDIGSDQERGIFTLAEVKTALKEVRGTEGLGNPMVKKVLGCFVPEGTPVEAIKSALVPASAYGNLMTLVSKVMYEGDAAFGSPAAGTEEDI